MSPAGLPALRGHAGHSWVKLTRFWFGVILWLYLLNNLREFEPAAGEMQAGSAAQPAVSRPHGLRQICMSVGAFDLGTAS
ncbi:MAG: hypothetical protein DRI37_06550 [Chloroflexi bacterium]|nr:MAG: hypothetical protein DRI37_06550 [Chloroflexota bacterium]